MFVLVASRLAFRAPLPDPLAPTMAILMAPPAVGGLSWFAYGGGKLDSVEQGLLGIAAIFVLMQLVFLRRYMRLTFSLGFWSFAFPSAFMAAFEILWISKAPFAGWQVLAWLLLAIVTVLIVSIAVFSIRLFVIFDPTVRSRAGRGGRASGSSTFRRRRVHRARYRSQLSKIHPRTLGAPISTKSNRDVITRAPDAL